MVTAAIDKWRIAWSNHALALPQTHAAIASHLLTVHPAQLRHAGLTALSYWATFYPPISKGHSDQRSKLWSLSGGRSASLGQ